MKNYYGIIRIEDAKVTLEAGGIKVRLEGNQEEFFPREGLFTLVNGEQYGDTIRNAKLSFQPESAFSEPSENGIFAPVIALIESKAADLSSLDGVFGVRPGFRTIDGELTEEPAIIVITKPGEPVSETPLDFDGIPVEVRVATPHELTEGLTPLSIWKGMAAEAAPPKIGYRPPENITLQETMVNNLTCHVGPDSGWTTLKPFLEGTTTSLTVAMYEFYANHIIDTITDLGRETDVTLNMILQVSSNDQGIEDTLEDSWKERLKFTRAAVSGANRIFNNSYHTKVVVRDSSAFWLSSGNWSPNSQPSFGPGFEQVLYSKGNREWHVIIENETLAGIFEKFIEHDISQARGVGEPESAPVLPDLLIPEALLEREATVLQERPFVAKTFASSGNPVRVKPLMSPDNYAAEILELVENAERSLYLQFSYIRRPSGEKFNAIIDAIADKMNAGLDVRVLVGSNQNPEHSEFLIGTRRWKRRMFRRQTSKIHNKGIIIDGKIAVVGSNNWSSDGTQYNRDASLVFYSRPIAQFFNEVFLFDWNNLSKPITSIQESMPVIAPETGSTPLGMVRIPWQAWFDE